MIPLIILYELIKCIIFSFFKKKYFIITHPLFSYKTFRLNGAKIDFLLPARYLKASIIQTLRKIKKDDFTIYNENAVILNDHKSTNNSRLEYVNTIDKNNTYKIITREETYINGSLNKLVTIVICIILMIIIYPFYIIPYKKNKNQLPLMIHLFSEWVSLVSFLKLKKWKHIYDFSSFEFDANFITYLVEKFNINSFKFPPSVPMDQFYKHVYADVFCTTLYHHKYDIKKFKKNWIFNKIEHWPLENYNLCLPHIIPEKIDYKYDIGYISSGSVMRKKNRNIYNELWEIEEDTLLCLKHYLKNRQQLKLFIFLHPLEKENKRIFSEIKIYYREIFKGSQLSFSELDRTSQEYFSTVNLTISVRSQANYQRLFCGYKSILYIGSKRNKNPIKDPNLMKINTDNFDFLEFLIEKTLKMSEDEFFNYYNINDYRYNSTQNRMIFDDQELLIS